MKKFKVWVHAVFIVRVQADAYQEAVTKAQDELWRATISIGSTDQIISLELGEATRVELVPEER